KESIKIFFISDLIRLTGSGSTRCSGRVEVYHNNSWGTVCDDGWDLNDAAVVCRQINCGSALEAPQSAHFGEGTGQIWLDDVTCSGNESSLIECNGSGFGTYSCGNHADVICSGEKAFRLAGSGSTRCSGRVEIYYNNIWGTVCDDYWDLKDAQVVCRQINCGTALEAPRSALFGAGTGQIWLDNVGCSGNESSLIECKYNQFGTNNCGHQQDAGVICSGPIRLVGSGLTRCSGRVEIYHNNSWGTVCDDGWDLNDAEVVCRQLNCGSALEAPHSAYYGAGTGQIWLDHVTCSGGESSLTECQHSGFGTNNCGHGQDAGVICSDLIRLAGSGSTRCSGRVEVYHNNSFGTVCDDGWNLNDAEIVCRQLNCGTARGAPRSAHFGAGTGQIWLDRVTCSGSEGSLTQCQHGGFGTNNCLHNQDAGVVCSDLIRLVGSGSTRCSGRVEVYHNNSWGTVCDDSWDLNDAQVVCRELNCGTALGAPPFAQFGAGTGQIWLDNVTCSGNEYSLTDCQHSGFGSNKCGHDHDAGAICSGVPILLAGSGSTRCSGRVEVYHNNSWGTVFCDDGWDLNDAEVVCREVKCGPALQAPQFAYFGQGTGQIWLDEVTCSGNENFLTGCQFSGFGAHNCKHSQDAGVICSLCSQLRWHWIPTQPNHPQRHNPTCSTRLAGSGSTRCSGRVEIYHNNIWGTVCDDGWDLNDAEVVCRELNCGPALEATQMAHFGAGSGQIWLDIVTCSGNESSLTECQHGGWGTNNCAHDQDAGVICSVGSGLTTCSGRVEIYHNNIWGTVCGDSWDLNAAEVVCRQFNCWTALEAPQNLCVLYVLATICGLFVLFSDIRLAGSGLTQCSGRVEIYHNNIWGTVCDDGWDLNAAEVVCRQLNCGPVLEAHQNAYFGEGTGEIWLDEVTCSGSEDFLTDCPNSGFGNHDCDHSEDASVICSGEIYSWSFTRCQILLKFVLNYGCGKCDWMSPCLRPDALSKGVTPSEKVGSWRKLLVKVNLAAVDSSVDMKDPAVMESIMNSVTYVKKS
uniref:SRCR domain-containing protein n=1 Tax=Pundamilia nyererei TaxID=303518 RepID=A0A3B4GVS4_9CICH